MKTDIPEYTGPLIEQIYEGIPQIIFDFVANRMALAARINEAIKAQGWTQKQFADAMHKKSSEVSRWLSGTHNFTTDTLWQIEQVLSIRLLEIATTDSNSVFEAEKLRVFVLQEVNKALDKYLKTKKVAIF